MAKNLVFLILLIPIFSFSQDTNDELIYWKDRQQLTWADYKGTPNPKSEAAASTATYLGIEYNFNNNNFGYKITCSFSKTRSWGLNKDEYILSHEQGHFDIAEIFARELNKKMSDYKFNSKRFKTDLKDIYKDITDQKEAYQNLYDKETNHSILKEKQKEWKKSISDRLASLQAFAGY